MNKMSAGNNNNNTRRAIAASLAERRAAEAAEAAALAAALAASRTGGIEGNAPVNDEILGKSMLNEEQRLLKAALEESMKSLGTNFKVQAKGVAKNIAEEIIAELSAFLEIEGKGQLYRDSILLFTELEAILRGKKEWISKNHENHPVRLKLMEIGEILKKQIEDTKPDPLYIISVRKYLHDNVYKPFARSHQQIRREELLTADPVFPAIKAKFDEMSKREFEKREKEKNTAKRIKEVSAKLKLQQQKSEAKEAMNAAKLKMNSLRQQYEDPKSFQKGNPKIKALLDEATRTYEEAKRIHNNLPSGGGKRTRKHRKRQIK